MGWEKNREGTGDYMQNTAPGMLLVQHYIESRMEWFLFWTWPQRRRWFHLRPPAWQASTSSDGECFGGSSTPHLESPQAWTAHCSIWAPHGARLKPASNLPNHILPHRGYWMWHGQSFLIYKNHILAEDPLSSVCHLGWETPLSGRTVHQSFRYGWF